MPGTSGTRLIVSSLLAAMILVPSFARAQDKFEVAEDRPIRALFVCGGCCHDYKMQKDIITKGISARANVQWVIAYDPVSTTAHKNPVYDNAEWYKDFDVVVHDECSADVKDLAVIDGILKPHKDGLPAVVIHCGMHCYRSEGWPKTVTPWFELTGLQTTGHGAQLPIAITYVDKESPITKGLEDWTTIHEELYNNIAGKVLDTAHPLARGKQGDNQTVVAWTNIYNGKTRVFGTTIGHNNETCADGRYLDLVTRGLLWSVDKLDEKHLKPAAKVLLHPEAAPEKADASTAHPNLATGKTATASSNENGHDPKDAVDGSLDSRWCAAGGSMPQWLQVDLGKPADVAGVRIVWEKEDGGYKFKIEGSADASTWKTLSDQTNTTDPAQSRLVKFDVAKGIQFVRLTITEANGGAWASVCELEVLDTKGLSASAAKGGQTTVHGVKAPAGFDLSLIAAPPEVAYPTCIAATPDGQLFVGVDDQGSLGKETGHGKVLLLSGLKGDGKPEKISTFAMMDHPRGLAWDASSRTLYVLHPPFLTAYHDDKAEGVSSRSEELITGVANEKAQEARGADHTTNGIRLGIDGWIYIAQGDFGCVKAVAADGTTLQHHGGGILRIRPDGTGLEIYSHGHRNIYDVSVDPLGNVFTRDNTNDGDNWNDRLAYIVPTGVYGYPSLFMHFPGEFVDCLADYGGGAPCGSIYIDEPGFPGDYGRGLYTVEWGNSVVDRHPLTPDGANFKAAREKFVDAPRGTDVDVDGQSRLYISSWANGGFSYSGPNVGFIYRLSPTGYMPPAFPDLKNASDEQLLGCLNSPSGVCRQSVQREILHRGDKPVFAYGLQKIAASDAPLAVRAAAVYTLRLLRGDAANGALMTLAEKDDLREIALRALCDIKGDKSVQLAPFIHALKDPNPRVRLVAAWGVGRLGAADAAEQLVPLMADPDFLVSHVTTQALIALHGTDAALKAVNPSTPNLVVNATRVLQAFHEDAVVEGLLGKLKSTADSNIHGAVLAALCRLCYREADWDGSWWGTRPDTTGPYFKNAEWEDTAKVKAAIGSALSSESPAVVRGLLINIEKHKIELPGMSDLLAKAANADPSLNEVMLDLLQDQKELKADQITQIKSIALSHGVKSGVRMKALRLLEKNPKNSEALDGAVDVLAASSGAIRDAEMAAATDEFTRDTKFSQSLPYFKNLASSDSAPKREIAYGVLVNLASNRLVKPKDQAAASAIVEKGWAKPQDAASLLRAIGRGKADSYKADVNSRVNDPDKEVAAAAAYAAGMLKNNASDAAKGQDIESIGYEKTVATVLKEKGNPSLGKELFTRQGCIACHTTSPEQPPKGPFLGGIALRYNRSELCESIMKPSAKIAQGFETQWFKTKSGDVIEGFVGREAGDEVEVHQVSAIVITLKKKDIERRGKRDTSIMPEGLVARLTPQELASLISYLESLPAK